MGCSAHPMAFAAEVGFDAGANALAGSSAPLGALPDGMGTWVHAVWARLNVGKSARRLSGTLDMGGVAFVECAFNEPRPSFFATFA